MRFYPGAYEALANAARFSNIEDQQLFLVEEPQNEYDENAVMLHNGVQKLGSVCATDAPRVRQLLRELHKSYGGGVKDERVLVCGLHMVNPHAIRDYKPLSLRISVKQHVNERAARKLVDSKKEK